MKKYVVVALVLFSVPLYAQSFLDTTYSGRAAGMGHSYTSLATGSDSLLWNPAGLSAKSSDVQLYGTRAFETQFVAVQGAVGPIGMGYVQAGMDGAKESVLVGTVGHETGKELSYKGEAFLVGTGLTLLPDLSVGATAKLIRETNAGALTQSYAVDYGARYEVLPWLSVSSVFQNSTVIGGAAVKMESVVATLEARKTKVRAGIEVSPIPHLALRAGYADNQVTLGTGLNVAPFRLDAAWQSPKAGIIDDIYRVSVTYSLGGN
jgi:hypothetical protein